MAVRETGRGIGKAGTAIDEIGTVGGGGAIQGAEVEAEIAGIAMVMTVAEGIVPVLVLKGVERSPRMLGMSRRRRKRRRQRRMMEQIIQIPRLQNKTG